MLSPFDGTAQVKSRPTPYELFRDYLAKRPETPAKRWWRAFCQVMVALYLPYSWVLTIDYSWSEYHLQWLGLSPVLPGILPGVLLRGLGFSEVPAMAAATLLLVFVCTLIASRGRTARWIVIFLALAASIVCAMGARAAFLA